MNMKVTPEDVSKLVKEMGGIWLANLTIDELLEHFGREKVLSHIKLVDRLAGLEPKEVLSHFKLADRLAGLEPKEVLPHFKPVDLLAGLEPEVIEDYLKQLKKQQH